LLINNGSEYQADDKIHPLDRDNYSKYLYFIHRTPLSLSKLTPLEKTELSQELLKSESFAHLHKVFIQENYEVVIPYHSDSKDF